MADDTPEFTNEGPLSDEQRAASRKNMEDMAAKRAAIVASEEATPTGKGAISQTDRIASAKRTEEMATARGDTEFATEMKNAQKVAASGFKEKAQAATSGVINAVAALTKTPGKAGLYAGAAALITTAIAYFVPGGKTKEVQQADGTITTEQSAGMFKKATVGLGVILTSALAVQAGRGYWANLVAAAPTASGPAIS